MMKLFKGISPIYLLSIFHENPTIKYNEPLYRTRRPKGTLIMQLHILTVPQIYHPDITKRLERLCSVECYPFETIKKSRRGLICYCGSCVMPVGQTKAAFACMPFPVLLVGKGYERRSSWDSRVEVKQQPLVLKIPEVGVFVLLRQLLGVGQCGPTTAPPSLDPRTASVSPLRRKLWHNGRVLTSPAGHACHQGCRQQVLTPPPILVGPSLSLLSWTS